MADITAALVKELRERTGAGMMDCKKALTEANGDIELAIENMRKSGAIKAAKKAGPEISATKSTRRKGAQAAKRVAPEPEAKPVSRLTAGMSQAGQQAKPVSKMSLGMSQAGRQADAAKKALEIVKQRRSEKVGVAKAVGKKIVSGLADFGREVGSLGE